MKEVLKFLAQAEKAIFDGGLDGLPGAISYALNKEAPELAVYGELEGRGGLWRIVMGAHTALIEVMVPGISGTWLISRQIKL